LVDPKLVSSRVPKKRATIKDVARASNVSPMTVSNVLNDKLQFVSSKTKARVEREITRLNYRRQTAGRNLRSADQRSIGLVVVSDDSAFLEDQFAAKIAAGLANSLNKADYTLTVQGVRADTLSDAMIMRNFDVAGVCAMVSGPIEVRNRVVNQLHALSQPLILFQQTNTEEVDDLCTIRLDEHASGEIIDQSWHCGQNNIGLRSKGGLRAFRKQCRTRLELQRSQFLKQSQNRKYQCKLCWKIS
jgi:LacI family transcriptional regulator